MAASSSENPLQSSEPSDARFSLGTLLGAMTVVAIVAAIAGVILRNVAADTRERLLTFWGIWLAGSIMFAAIAMQQRRAAEQRAGRTLLKLPMWPSANSPVWLNWHIATNLFFALLMLPLASLLVADNPAATRGDWLMHYALPTMYAFLVTANVFPILLWNHHVRFCENGILADRKVLLWSELLEHCFKGSYLPKLELKSANNDHNHPWLAISIDPDQVALVKELIAERTSNAVRLPTGVPVSLGQAPLTAVFRYPHLRKHLVCASVSVGVGAWLVYLGWVNSPANREFQESILFALYAWSFLQGWRFHWFVGSSGAPIARIFGRRDVLGFTANVGSALGLYYANANVVWPFWWLGYFAGAGFVFFTINTASYYFLTQLDLRPERAIIPGALSWAWPNVKLHRWDAARGKLVLGRGWRRVTAFVPPDQTEAVDRLLREKRLLNDAAITTPVEC